MCSLRFKLDCELESELELALESGYVLDILIRVAVDNLFTALPLPLSLSLSLSLCLLSLELATCSACGKEQQGSSYIVASSQRGRLALDI